MPNGKYRVLVNLDSPSGFWGEYQVYRNAGGAGRGPAGSSATRWTSTRCKQKYFRFWNVEDSPDDNTFDKYQRAYFQEKEFDVTVTDGQLNLEFRGENWACCVSAVVLYPADRGGRGAAFPEGLVAKRRFYFDNYFNRVLHKPTGEAAAAERCGRAARLPDLHARLHAGRVLQRHAPDPMRSTGRCPDSALAGELEPLTLALYPLADLGSVTVTPQRSDGTGGTIPASCDRRGFRVQPRQPRDDGRLGLHHRTAAGHASRHGCRAART